MTNQDQILAYRKLVGQWIQQIREDKGISKNELSKLSGIDRKYINGIESGKYAFSIDIIAKISYALGIYILFIENTTDGPLADAMRNKWGNKGNYIRVGTMNVLVENYFILDAPDCVNSKGRPRRYGFTFTANLKTLDLRGYTRFPLRKMYGENIHFQSSPS